MVMFRKHGPGGSNCFYLEQWCTTRGLLVRDYKATQTSELFVFQIFITQFSNVKEILDRTMSENQKKISLCATFSRPFLYPTCKIDPTLKWNSHANFSANKF